MMYTPIIKNMHIDFIKTIQNENKIAIIQYKNAMLKDDKKTLVCDWKNLQGKKILNDNILIKNFYDIHPFTNPPIFANAKNIYLSGNYKYFHYYWINKKIFPTMPRIYLDGHPCDSPVLNRGFRIHIIDSFYHTAIRYANEINADTSLITKINREEYDLLINSGNIEEIILKDYHQNDKEFDKLTTNDIKNNNGIISASIFEKTKWD